MKKFTATKFFRILQEASQTGIAVSTHVLKTCYERFVMLLYAQIAAFNSKAACHDALEYTRVELVTLMEEVSEKKCGDLSEKGNSSC